MNDNICETCGKLLKYGEIIHKEKQCYSCKCIKNEMKYLKFLHDRNNKLTLEQRIFELEKIFVEKLYKEEKT